MRLHGVSNQKDILRHLHLHEISRKMHKAEHSSSRPSDPKRKAGRGGVVSWQHETTEKEVHDTRMPDGHLYR